MVITSRVHICICSVCEIQNKKQQEIALFTITLLCNRSKRTNKKIRKNASQAAKNVYNKHFNNGRKYPSTLKKEVVK